MTPPTAPAIEGPCRGSLRASVFFIAAAIAGSAAAQDLPYRVLVVNMIPVVLSGEAEQDSEPNIAVDPADPRNIVATALTPNAEGIPIRAPVFLSQDRGKTWWLSNILPSGDGKTADISVAYSGTSTLYAGILVGGGDYHMNVLRSANPFSTSAMDPPLVDAGKRDQPWVEAQSADLASGSVDRVYVGNNNRAFKISDGGDGKTASVDYSLDAATAPPPAGFASARIEVRSTNQQDMPAVRTAVHRDGKVYAIFYRRVSGTPPDITCDLVVVRDDNWASGSDPFKSLKESPPGGTSPGDGEACVRVARGISVPAGFADPAGPFLGQNRLAGSNLSIAVDPRDSGTVWIAWAEQAGSAYTLHVARSADAGATWSTDPLSIANATNPALAVNSLGQAGFLYQQVVGVASAQRWQTHLQRKDAAGAWSDLVLADTPAGAPAPRFQPYIGDYADLVAVGRAFFGVFSASNVPDAANFPNGVTYQRNADFNGKILLDAAGVAPIDPSIDPFFFSVTPPTIVDACKADPTLCSTPVMRTGRLAFTCDVVPCRVIDPMPKNCIVKFRCGGCRPGGLCPPWHHLRLTGLDPAQWRAGIYRGDGSVTDYRVHRTRGGLVVSWKPSRKEFRAGEVGDYFLALESDTAGKGTKVSVGTRLELSPRPYGAR